MRAPTRKILQVVTSPNVFSNLVWVISQGPIESMIHSCVRQLPLSLGPRTVHQCGEPLDLASIAPSEKHGQSSPGIYDGSTVVSEPSPGFRRSRSLDAL